MFTLICLRACSKGPIQISFGSFSYLFSKIRCHVLGRDQAHNMGTMCSSLGLLHHGSNVTIIFA